MNAARVRVNDDTSANGTKHFSVALRSFGSERSMDDEWYSTFSIESAMVAGTNGLRTISASKLQWLRRRQHWLIRRSRCVYRLCS